MVMLFKRKKKPKTERFNLIFEKQKMPQSSVWVYKIPTDSYFVAILCNLQKKYNFKIINAKFNDWNECRINIECDKGKSMDIFNSFVIDTNGRAGQCKIERQ